MEAAELNAEIREEKGKSSVSRMRRKGLLPAVLYGREVSNIKMRVKSNELEKIFNSVGDHGLIKVILNENGNSEEYLTLVREVQRNPVKGSLLHVDFQQISAREKFQTEVPIHLVGDAPGVQEGGILQYGNLMVEVECSSMDLPENIEVDVSDLNIGDTLTIADLPEIPGVKILSEPDMLIASVVLSRMTIEKEEEEEAPLEGEEAEEGEQEEEGREPTEES